MAFSKTAIIKYLRDSVVVQDPSVVADTVWLSMTDEDLEMVLLVSKQRDFPQQQLDNLDEPVIFPLMLIAKKELYYRLAVKSSPEYDIKGSDGGLLKNQRYVHFMGLIKQTEEDYFNYMENGYFGEKGIGDLNNGVAKSKIQVGNLMLTSRYYSRRSYGLYLAPAVSVSVSDIGADYVKLRWSASGIVTFYKYDVYIHTSEILDEYSNDKINTEANLVMSTVDQRNTCTQALNLTPSTRYYILVVCHEANSICGYGGVVFDTLAGMDGV